MKVGMTAQAECVSGTQLRELAKRRFAQSVDVPTEFFELQADEIARACLEMARRFHGGGRLLVFGEGAEATDAQHVSVEFVHPVIVGKRALPAISLTNDIASLTGRSREAPGPGVFAQLLGILGRDIDIAMGLSRDGDGKAVLRGLKRGRELGMLTLGIAAGDGGRMHRTRPADFVFLVPSADPMVVQEVQETLYHVLWELVHVFFENRVD